MTSLVHWGYLVKPRTTDTHSIDWTYLVKDLEKDNWQVQFAATYRAQLPIIKDLSDEAMELNISVEFSENASIYYEGAIQSRRSKVRSGRTSFILTQKMKTGKEGPIKLKGRIFWELKSDRESVEISTIPFEIEF